MDAATMDRAAAWLARARQNGTSVGEMPAELKPATAEDGYAIQRRVREKMIAGGRGALIGWKVGATTVPMQKLLNLPGPAAGPILASARLTTPAKLNFADYRKVGIECEVCITLKSPLPAAPGQKTDRKAAAAAVGSIRPAIEVVDNRYGDFTSIGAPTIIADGVFHNAVILGPEIKDWQQVDLAECDGTTSANGEVKLRGKGKEVLGHPLESLAWLANLLSAQGERLEAGQIVMTGSLPLPYWANKGENVEIRIAGLGAAAATLA
ncbi:MAG: fumarylacetoacetate hydrolase family protein [Alphaproteobacteria bacterium]|nr:fumarylacetoacetate hydrolase family protein [Alphaproteobacteria bacterium]